MVVDEVVGQWIALAGARPFNWKSCLAAFAAVPPLRYLEAAAGAAIGSAARRLGINADDVMAGVYAALVLLVAGCFNLY